MYNDKINAVTDDFISKDLFIFESGNFEETLQFDQF